MAALVPAGIRLVAVGVESFRAAVGIANQANQSFRLGLRGVAADAGSSGGPIAELNRHMTDLGNSARETAQNLVQGIPGALRTIILGFGGIGAAIVAATTALGGLIQALGGLASIKFAAEVERDFQFIRAVLQASNEDMKRLLGTAEQLASNLPVAFRDIGSQLRELGRAGISIDEIAASVGKLTASLSILARGEASPTKIAEALASGAKAFQATGGTIDDVAKSILGVANATRLSIPEVISAFNKAAPVAGIFRQTSEELGAFIALVGSAGIRGEEAGTGIRNFFLRLANPSADAAEQLERFNLSMFDLEGKTRPAVDVIRDLQRVYGQTAIEEGRLTEATRAYSLSQIFQTRTAAVAALAIIQGAEAYNEYLQVIQDTDPIRQAALATDNLLDRLEVLRNRASVIANVFGQGVLPGLRTFVNRVDETIGDVSDPSNKIRQSAAALGQGIASLFTGSGIGQAADALEAQFGATVANVFEAVAQSAARIREVITNEVLPAVQELFNAIGRLALGTVFNPGAVNSFGQAIVQVTGFFAGLVRMTSIVIGAINDIRPAALQLAVSVGQAFGLVFEAIGTSINGLFITFRDAANPLLEKAKELREIQKTLQESGSPNLGLAARLQPQIDLLERLGNTFGTVGAAGLQIQGNFEGITGRISQATEELQRMIQTEVYIRNLARATRELQTELGRLEELQLAEEGPDVQVQILALRQQIATNREIIQSTSGVVDMEEALAAANEQVRLAYDKLVRSGEQTEGQFDNLLARGREEARQKAEIATATRRLSEVYDDLGRSVARATREMGDRLDDLVTKTNTALQKLGTETKNRIQEVRDNLKQANKDAREAFDFETLVRNQRLSVTQMFEDTNIAISRTFDTQRRAQSDSIEDRERGRQREQQQIESALQRQVDENVRANSEINEDFSRALSQRNEDLQRALQRSHQIQTEQLSETFRIQNEGRARTNEDAARQRNLVRELAKAKTDEERRSIQERFQEETTSIGERRQLEASEANIRRQQEKQLQDLRLKQENETLNVTRALARQELDIRRQLAREERDFKLQQELALFAIRLGLEERFIAQTRGLRDQIDIPRAQGLEDRQRGVQRQVQAGERTFEDFFRERGFDRDAFLRARGASRQEEEILKKAQERFEEIIQGAEEERIRIVRDAQQKLVDLQEQALNTLADTLRRVGVNFPGADAFRAQQGALFGNAAAQQAALGANISDRFVLPNLGITAPTQTAQIPPELLALATIPAAALNARFGELVLALTTLTTAIQTRAATSGVNLTIDDFNINDSIVLGDNAVDRIGELAGQSLVNVVRFRGGQ